MTEAPQEIRLIDQHEFHKGSPPAYFTFIEIENVLCFKTCQKLNLSDGNGFPAQWTVILGDNGTGKTTLLRCLAGMEPFFGASFNEDDQELVPSLFPSSTSSRKEIEILRLAKAHIKANLMYGDSLNNWKGFSSKRHEQLSGFYNKILDVAVFSADSVSASTLQKGILDLKCYGLGGAEKS